MSDRPDAPRALPVLPARGRPETPSGDGARPASASAPSRSGGGPARGDDPGPGGGHATAGPASRRATLAGPSADDGEDRLRDLYGRRLRDLRVSVVDRCNFRCPYCMPEEVYGEGYEFLSRDELLDFEEIVRLVRVFAGAGAVKLRLTGGEPLLRPNLESLVDRVRGVEGIEDLAMTTNGYLLARHAAPLRDAGLDRVTVSLDGLDEETFERMSGRAWGLEEVLEGIDAALEAGLDPVKLNMVVKRDANDEAVLEMARRFRGTGVVVRFIEYMDVGTLNGWRLEDVVPSRELLERIDAEMPLVPVEKRHPGEVADRYRYADGSGEIGFISSVSQPFCGDCVRARLSADGTLHTCLFATDGTDFRGPLRDGATDEELSGLLGSVWRRRGDRYSERRTARTRAAGDGARANGAGSGAGSSPAAGAAPGDAPEADRVEMFRMGG